MSFLKILLFIFFLPKLFDVYLEKDKTFVKCLIYFEISSNIFEIYLFNDIFIYLYSFHWQMEDQHNLVTNNSYNASSHPPDYIGPPEPKRRIVSGETVVHFETSPLVGQHTAQPVTSGYYYPVIPRNEARAIVLEDENALLRKKIEELKKQVSLI